MSKFTITFKDGSKEPIKGITFEKMLEFMEQNISGLNTDYEISDQVRKQKETKDKDQVSGRVAFMRSLSPSQHEGIKNGTRKVRYSENPEIGYYLQVIHPKIEDRPSTEVSAHTRFETIKEHFTQFVAYERKSIISFMNAGLSDFNIEMTDEDITKLIAKIDRI